MPVSYTHLDVYKRQVFDAVAGVQPQSETVWRQASRYGVPRIAYINKYDRVGADFFHAIDTMHDRLHAPAVAAQIPMGAEDNFWGVVDLVTMTAWDFKADDKGMTYPEPMDAIPDEFIPVAEERRQMLLEAAADCDDDLMEKVLMEEEVSVEEDVYKRQFRFGLGEAWQQARHRGLGHRSGRRTRIRPIERIECQA